MDFSNFPPPSGKSLKGAPAKPAKPAKVPKAPKVKAAMPPAKPKGRAGLSKSHNPANHLSAMPYANGGMVKGKKGC